MASIAPPRAARAPRASNKWLVLVLVCLAQFMVVLDATIVNVALPSIQRGLRLLRPPTCSGSSTPTRWSSAASCCWAGAPADLLGRKRLFLIGVVALHGRVAAQRPGRPRRAAHRRPRPAGPRRPRWSPRPRCRSSPPPSRSGRERTQGARRLGARSPPAARAVGLLLGGILTEYLSWEWVFFVNVPVGIAAFAARRCASCPSRAARRRPRGFDLAGAVTVTAGLIAAGLRDRRRRRSTAGARPGRSALGAVALVLLAAFVAHRAPLRAPLVRLSIFKIRSLAGANLRCSLVAGGMFAVFFFASLYVQDMLGFTPLKAGLAFLPADRRHHPLLRHRPAARSAGSACARSRWPAWAWPRSAWCCSRSVPVDGTYLRRRPARAWLMLSPASGMTFVPLTLIATTDVARRGRRPGLGAVQLLAADRRRARPGHPLDAGRQPHDQTRSATRGATPRRPSRPRRSSTASRWRSRSARA